MKVSIWGCVQRYPKDEHNTISFLGNLAVESYEALRSIEPPEGERIILLSIRNEVKNDSPIWLIFESQGEAELLQELLAKAIEAYKKDEDYRGGSISRTFGLS